MHRQQKNITMFYLFKGVCHNTAELRTEICNTLGGVAWVDIRVYESSSRCYFVYTSEGSRQGPCIPVKITSTEDAHFTMALAFSDRVYGTCDNIKGGVQAVIEKYNGEFLHGI